MVSDFKSKVKLNEFDASENFDRGAGSVKFISWYMIKMVFFLSSFPYPNALKRCLLRLYGAKVGKGVIIKPRVNIHFPWKLEVGDYVWIGEEVFILNFERIIIGNNVCVSQRAFLCGGNHDYKDPSMPYKNGPITLSDGSWVGANVFVAPNVHIGSDTIISAASVVLKTVEENSIYKGNPAVFVKKRWQSNGLVE